MKVLVFDIDGTLTLTNQVDHRFFRAAIRSRFTDARLDSFDRFADMTDAGILQDVCAEHRETDYAAVETEVLEHFMTGLTSARDTEPASFGAVPGAQSVLSLIRDAGWVPAIATGCWRPSASLKLEAAGIGSEGVPLATSSQTRRRVDIIRLAVAEASSGARPDEVVYVGDGTWDVRACRELGIGFVGRGTGDAVGRLKQLGARSVVDDFTDENNFLRALALSDLLPSSDAVQT